MLRFLSLLSDATLSNFDLNKYPYKLTFAITYRCNYRCKHCSIWKKNPKNELSLEEIKLFIKKFPYFKWINLTGGEPFLRQDIVKIVETFFKHSYSAYVFNTTTNGFSPSLITKKVLEILSLDIPKLIVVVSLDGYKELHEEIRGIPNSYRNALETFKSLKSLSKSYKNLETYFGYTISPFNVGKFKKTFMEVKKEIKDLKPKDFHFNIYHSSAHYYANFGLISGEEIINYVKKLKEELNFVLKLKNALNFLVPSRFLDSLYIKLTKKYIEKNKTPLPCKSLQSSVFIDSLGNVFPCTIFSVNLGNLREFDYDLKKILEQDKVRKMKIMVRSLKCPNCWTPCEAYQTILGNIGKFNI